MLPPSPLHLTQCFHTRWLWMLPLNCHMIETSYGLFSKNIKTCAFLVLPVQWPQVVTIHLFSNVNWFSEWIENIWPIDNFYQGLFFLLDFGLLDNSHVLRHNIYNICRYIPRSVTNFICLRDILQERQIVSRQTLFGIKQYCSLVCSWLLSGVNYHPSLITHQLHQWAEWECQIVVSAYTW